MGNARIATSEEGGAKRAHGNRVEVSLLKNSVDQLVSANQPDGEMNSNSQAPRSNYAAPSSYQSAPTQPQSNSMNSAPANSNPPQQY
jgi:hypothetical protein